MLSFSFNTLTCCRSIAMPVADPAVLNFDSVADDDEESMPIMEVDETADETR